MSWDTPGLRNDQTGQVTAPGKETSTEGWERTRGQTLGPQGVVNPDLEKLHAL